MHSKMSSKTYRTFFSGSQKQIFSRLLMLLLSLMKVNGDLQYCTIIKEVSITTSEVIVNFVFHQKANSKVLILFINVYSQVYVTLSCLLYVTVLYLNNFKFCARSSPFM